MNFLRYIGHAFQLLEHPKFDLLCCACIIEATACYVYLTGPKAQTKVAVLSVFLVGFCLVTPLLYAVEDIDHVLEWLVYRWDILCFAFILVASVCYVCSIAPNVKAKILVLSVFLAGFCWIVNQAALSYNILLLSVEEDELAKDAYFYLSDHLSDKQVVKFLSPEEKDKFLTNTDARFYLALIAEQRRLPINPKTILKKPFFFGNNGVNELSDQLTYPVAYKDFCKSVPAQ